MYIFIYNDDNITAMIKIMIIYVMGFFMIMKWANKYVEPLAHGLVDIKCSIHNNY